MLQIIIFYKDGVTEELHYSGTQLEALGYILTTSPRIKFITQLSFSIEKRGRSKRERETA